jgi:hypothetical protein
VADLTQVLNDKNKELEDVVDEHKKVLAAALKERDKVRTATAAAQKQLEAWKKKHEADLATEREASSGTILALQHEKTSFEGFVREMSRQLLGKCRVFPSLYFVLLVLSKVSLQGRVPERGESARASPRGRVPEFPFANMFAMSFSLLEGTCDFVETTTPRECLETATTLQYIIKCATDILAALQYLNPREWIPHDAS